MLLWLTAVHTEEISASSIARWPKFRPKSSKGAGEKKLAGRFCDRILPEVAEKGPKNIFYRSSLFTGTDTLSETKKKCNCISNWPIVWLLNWRFNEIGRFLFSKKAAELFWCTGRKTISGLVNTVCLSLSPMKTCRLKHKNNKLDKETKK
jgi:hypothetical protein